MIDKKLWDLWKEYRSGPSWRGDPLYFKRWVEEKQKAKKVCWDSGRGEEIQRATLELDGFRVVIKVLHDEDSKLHDGDTFGDYTDEKEDHYAIDRHQGETPGWHSRDPRKRYYNEPKHSRYEEQRNNWLEEYATKWVEVRDARGLTLNDAMYGLAKGVKLSEETINLLYSRAVMPWWTIPVRGRLLRRCRYNGSNTRAKHEDDVHVRESIVKMKEIVDGWYADQWHYVGVCATAYKGDVELGDASCWGIEDSDDDYIDAQAYELAEEAVRNAKEEFEKMGGTSDSRCELISSIFSAAEDDGTDESLDAWLGFLYAHIAGGTVLDATDAPSEFSEFFNKHKELKKQTRLYVNEVEDD